MRIFQFILAVSLLLAAAVLSSGAEVELRAAPAKVEGADPLQQAEKAVHEEGGVPLKPVEIGHIGKFPITNSMLVTWIVALGIIVFAQVATRNIKEVPEGAQNFWEWLVESLYKFLESIVGHELV